MSLSELSTINFRNLKNQTFKFGEKVTALYGENAQGKTNILEAIYLLSTGKSFRTRFDHELITWGQTQAKVSGRADNLEPEIIIYPDKKEFLVNKQSKRLTDIIGSFIVIVFTPNDIEIISGSPDKRRRFLDQLGSNLDRKYLYQLISFNKIMRNRNQLLFQLKGGKNIDLAVWNAQLAKAASYIWHSRKELISKLNEILRRLGKKVAKTELKIEYSTPLIKDNKAKTEEYYIKQLNAILAEEIHRTTTQLGPHRDDFKIISEEEKGGKVITKDLTIYGSRGEQRAASLALKLSEVNLIRQDTHNQPTMLLDEVLSELDTTHRKLLLNQLRGQQTFITSTSLTPIKEVLGETFSAIEIREGEAN